MTVQAHELGGQVQQVISDEAIRGIYGPWVEDRSNTPPPPLTHPVVPGGLRRLCERLELPEQAAEILQQKIKDPVTAALLLGMEPVPDPVSPPKTLFESLPPRQQDVISHLSKPFDDIAEELGLPRRRVPAILQEARKNLEKQGVSTRDSIELAVRAAHGGALLLDQVPNAQSRLLTVQQRELLKYHWNSTLKATGKAMDLSEARISDIREEIKVALGVKTFLQAVLHGLVSGIVEPQLDKPNWKLPY